MLDLGIFYEQINIFIMNMNKKLNEPLNYSYLGQSLTEFNQNRNERISIKYDPHAIPPNIKLS